MDTPFNAASSLFADALPGLVEITCWATTLAHDELEPRLPVGLPVVADMISDESVHPGPGAWTSPEPGYAHDDAGGVDDWQPSEKSAVLVKELLQANKIAPPKGITTYVMDPQLRSREKIAEMARSGKGCRIWAPAGGANHWDFSQSVMIDHPVSMVHLVVCVCFDLKVFDTYPSKNALLAQAARLIDDFLIDMRYTFKGRPMKLLATGTKGSDHKTLERFLTKTCFKLINDQRGQETGTGGDCEISFDKCGADDGHDRRVRQLRDSYRSQNWNKKAPDPKQAEKQRDMMAAVEKITQSITSGESGETTGDENDQNAANTTAAAAAFVPPRPKPAAVAAALPIPVAVPVKKVAVKKVAASSKTTTTGNFTTGAVAAGAKLGAKAAGESPPKDLSVGKGIAKAAIMSAENEKFYAQNQREELRLKAKELEYREAKRQATEARERRRDEDLRRRDEEHRARMENDARTAQLTQQMMMQMLSQMRAHGGRVEVQHSFQANGEGEGDEVIMTESETIKRPRPS
jgi:hypothetical protein